MPGQKPAADCLVVGCKTRIVLEQPGITQWTCQRCGREFFDAEDGYDEPLLDGNYDVIEDGDDL